jgi:hypothetical protein
MHLFYVWFITLTPETKIKNLEKMMSCCINENDDVKKTQIGKFTLCYCEFNFLYVVNNL